MAKPMFFYAGIYDSTADPELDYEAIMTLHRSDAIGSCDSAIIVHRPDGETKEIGEMLEPGTSALVVIGIDHDDEQIEREVGDWEEAEQEALEAIARADQHAAV
jgi:hypothetical protein